MVNYTAKYVNCQEVLRFFRALGLARSFTSFMFLRRLLWFGYQKDKVTQKLNYPTDKSGGFWRKVLRLACKGYLIRVRLGRSKRPLPCKTVRSIRLLFSRSMRIRHGKTMRRYRTVIRDLEYFTRQRVSRRNLIYSVFNVL